MKTKETLFLLLCFILSTEAFSQKGPEWLKDAVIYHIYPSSFQDSDGNGIGDLKGIHSRLDYIRSIGVNTIWLSPIFSSEFKDGGYDITDFYRIDPRFGQNETLTALIQTAHSKGIRVCLDLVAGHTSDKHPWFLQSKQTDTNLQHSDYYIWTTDKKQKPQKYVDAPDAARNGYYMKNFFDCQPALNYEFAQPNPNHPWEQSVNAPGPQAVRRELKNIIAFWMDKGVDGFRVDMAQSLIKRDDRNHTATMQLWDEILSWFNKKYPEGIMMSEWSMPHEAIKAGFNIDLIIHNGVKIYRNLVCNTDDKGKPNNCYFDKSGNGQIKEFVTNYGKEYQATRNLGYATMPTCSHDIWRLNRLQRNTPKELKVALTLFLTMPWPPIIYYGEEIGMRNLEEAPYKEGSKSARNRSSCRTPMQWETGLNAGFSSAPSDQIYLPIDPADNYPNVASQENDRTSILNYVRTLLEVRKNIPAIGTRGDWKAISDIEQPYPFAYMRWIGDEQYFIALNPSGQKAETAVNLPDNSKIEWLAGTTSSYWIKTKKGETRLQMPATSAILCKIRTK